MDSNKWAYIGYACAWLATGAVVATAVIIIHSATPIWFMLFPLCISITSKKDEE